MTDDGLGKNVPENQLAQQEFAAAPETTFDDLALNENEKLISPGEEDLAQKIIHFDILIEELRKMKFDVLESQKALNEFKESMNEIIGSAETSKDKIEKITEELLTKKEEVENEAATIRENKITIDQVSSSIASKSAEIEMEQSSVTEKLKEISTDIESFLRKKTVLKELSDQIDAQSRQITAQTESFLMLSNKAQAADVDLSTKQAIANKKTKGIEAFHLESEKFFSELFVDKKDASGAISVVSTKSKIEQLHADSKAKFDEYSNLYSAANDQFEKTSKKYEQESADLISTFVAQFTRTKEDLTKMILSLLPGAGAAGLASTYFDAKKKYASTPIDIDPSKKFSIKYKLAHYLPSFLVTAFFYSLFMLPLWSVYKIFKPLATPGAFNEGGSFANIWLFRLAISAPLVALSWFGLSSIRLYRRLYEEYNHKQRVMQLYSSFKGELKDEDQRKTLLEIMLKTVGDKPSLAMNRYERTGIGKIIEQMLTKKNQAGGGSSD